MKGGGLDARAGRQTGGGPRRQGAADHRVIRRLPHLPRCAEGDGLAGAGRPDHHVDPVAAPADLGHHGPGRSP